MPANGPGPDQEQIVQFDNAYLAWSATRAAFASAIRKCAANRREKVARRCMRRTVVESSAGRLAADSGLRQATAVIHLSYTVVSDPSADTSGAPAENSDAPLASVSPSTG